MNSCYILTCSPSVYLHGLVYFTYGMAEQRRGGLADGTILPTFTPHHARH